MTVVYFWHSVLFVCYITKMLPSLNQYDYRIFTLSQLHSKWNLKPCMLS